MRRQAYVSRMRQPALIRRARLGLTQTAPRPVPADRPGPCLLRVDQARHGPVHLLDAAGHYRRHGWLRGAADRRLRPALQQRQPCRQGGVRPSRLQLNGFFLAQLAIGSPRSRRHHQRVHGRISPVHLRRRPATRCHARRQGGGLWRRRRRGRDHLLVRGVFTGQAILSAKDLETRIGTPGVIRSAFPSWCRACRLMAGPHHQIPAPVAGQAIIGRTKFAAVGHLLFSWRLRAVLRLCRRHAPRRPHHAEPARCLTRAWALDRPPHQGEPVRRLSPGGRRMGGSVRRWRSPTAHRQERIIGREELRDLTRVSRCVIDLRQERRALCRPIERLRDAWCCPGGRARVRVPGAVRRVSGALGAGRRSRRAAPHWHSGWGGRWAADLVLVR